ncbi:uncharacterized protein LOC134272133 [Saccostrea cucullata]|uniref:uncharacterized protein LOC134272133 n=1 Tax=Saccostrea cuccullata TaxID=36930 RepID=UPI002ED5443B
MRRLKFFGVLVIVINLKGSIGSLEYHVDWATASIHCKAKYDSHLIPQSYIEDQNLHGDVITGIGVNMSAWVDGKIQKIGCDQEKCLLMKSLLEKDVRKMPYICVTSKNIEINLTDVSFKTSSKLCKFKKVTIEDSLQRNGLLSSLNELSEMPSTSKTFWLPNVELSNNTDANCTFVSSRTSNFLETMYGNCSIRKMGVCINSTYLVDYEMSVILEINLKQMPLLKSDGIWTTKDILKTKGEEGKESTFKIQSQQGKIPSAKTLNDSDVHIQDLPRETVVATNGQIHGSPKYIGKKDSENFSALVSFILSSLSLVLVITFMCVGMVIWKRMSQRLDVLMKDHSSFTDEKASTKSTRKRKTTFQKKVYETLPPETTQGHGHSTRVKDMPREEENPYSQIAGRGLCRYHINSGIVGQAEADVNESQCLYFISFRIYGKKRMQLILCFHSLLGILAFSSLLTDILCSPEHYIDWSEASKQCKTKYESELITERYVEEQNLTAEIIQELGVNLSAWIDGKILDLGCKNDICQTIVKIHTNVNIRNPSICVTADGIKIDLTNMTFQEAQQWCQQEKFEIIGNLYKNILRDQVAKFSYKLKSPISYWVPNIELRNNQDVNCTYVVSRDNDTLETLYGNCSIPMMGVCINNSYIPDYQMSVLLELTPTNIPVFEINYEVSEEEDYSRAEALQVIGTKDDVHVEDLTKNNGYWDLKSILPFAISGFNLILFMTLVCVIIVLWKRITLKWKLLTKRDNLYDMYDPYKSRKKIRDYQGLPVMASGNSTRVKMVPEVDENPYSEIYGKESSGFSREKTTSVVPNHAEGYIDMRGLRRDINCSSFKIAKTPRRQLNSGYAESGEIV